MYNILGSFYSMAAFFIVVWLFNTSCQSNNERSQSDIGITPIILDSLRLIEKNAGFRCDYFKLQTTPECLINDIKKIEYDDSLFFIRDSNQKIFIFSYDGTYLYSIGNIGSGPNEMLSIFDFYLDRKKKTVNLVDIYREAVNIFDYKGNLISKLNYPKNSFQDVTNFNYLGNDSLLVTLCNNNHSLYNYAIKTPDNEGKNNCLKYLVTGEQSIVFSAESKIAQLKNNTYALAFLSDTIYLYNSSLKSIQPHLIFKGNFKNSRAEDFKGEEYELAIQAQNVARKKNISTGITKLYVINNFVSFQFCDSQCFRVFYNIEKKCGFYIPLNGNSQFNYIIASTDNAFVCALPMSEIFDNDISNDAKMSRIKKKSSEDDNPILVFYYLN